ncbi:MAG TPA: hypothetical protein PK977_01495 [Chitinophagaceae bacterium]|nr:hypothetical protein [Chitinophagaceae bacterium]
MKATFEEKSFENYFNSELDKKASIFFPFGQVQEGFLGFDASSFSKNRSLWRAIGYPFLFSPKFKGADLIEIAEEMENYLSVTINNMPNLKANLLFQYKRPEYVTSPKCAEWYLWNKPYYRYNIDMNQQLLLSKLHSSFSGRLLILYVSPAFHEINDLVHYKQKNKIIKNSNFTKAIDLNGHSKNTYITKGTYSIACSEPKRIKKINLENQLDALRSNISKFENNTQFIKDFSSQIRDIVSEDATYSNAFLRLNSEYSMLTDYSVFHSLLVMANFKNLTGAQWIITT